MTAASGTLLSAWGIDRLGDASLLPWLLALALLPWLAHRLEAAPAVSWPALDEARAAGARPLEIGRWLGTSLRFTGLLALAIVLCSPLATRELPPESGLGLDLVLVVDASESMDALDTQPGGAAHGSRSRLDLAREAVARFTARRVEEGDRVGLVVFGDDAFTQCPLTHDASLLRAALERVRIGVAGDSTALGDALALAVKRVSAAGSAERRVVVLLTDGRSNAGEIPVSVATELAVTHNVRVHTVAIGVGGHAVALGAGPGVRYDRHDPDPDALQHIASATRGRAFEARGSEDLLVVYDAIDRLERAPRALPPRVLETEAPAALLWLAAGALVAELVARRGPRRTLP